MTANLTFSDVKSTCTMYAYRPFRRTADQQTEVLSIAPRPVTPKRDERPIATHDCPKNTTGLRP